MGLECDLYCSGFLCALESGDGLGSIRQVDTRFFIRLSPVVLEVLKLSLERVRI